MRFALSACLIGTLLLVGIGSRFSDGTPANLRAAEDDGWTNLLTSLDDWKRVPIPPGGKLSKKNPWKLSDDGQTLICDGVGVHEMLLHKKEFGDGTFHAEWRFQPVEGKKGYNSGVYVRNSADGKIWHQAQVGDRNVGHLFGETPMNGELKRFRTKRQGEQRGKPPGEWNVYDITCADNRITLNVNGAVTTTWDECEVKQGYLGVEAEGWVIEFRELKWKGE